MKNINMFEHRDVIKMYKEKQRRKQCNRIIFASLVVVGILLILGLTK